ncbi:hypothetical protein HaLaN_26571, partial [Haematococcus lacustris]
MKRMHLARRFKAEMLAAREAGRPIPAPLPGMTLDVWTLYRTLTK